MSSWDEAFGQGGLPKLRSLVRGIFQAGLGEVEFLKTSDSYGSSFLRVHRGMSKFPYIKSWSLYSHYCGFQKPLKTVPIYRLDPVVVWLPQFDGELFLQTEASNWRKIWKNHVTLT